MGILMVASFVGVIFAGFPAMTYLLAKQKGRNAKKWLVIGILLPAIATIILSFLPDKHKSEDSSK